MITDPRFYQWLEGLEARHLSDLRFSELTRALRALSARYVERRGRLLERGAFDTAGKRAAYALYYSPLHFITVTLIVKALGAARLGGVTLDLGCGAGAAGAAGAGRAPDLSQMSPRDIADRLFDRVMRLSSEGKVDSAQFFATMAQ